MPYRAINIYYSVTCYTNHINSTRIQSIASMALMVFPDVPDRLLSEKWPATPKDHTLSSLTLNSLCAELWGFGSFFVFRGLHVLA